MKKPMILLTLLFQAVLAQAQVCCHPPTDLRTVKVDKADFFAAHQVPKPINYTQKEFSQTVTFGTLDGRSASAFYVPAREATTEVLVIFPEWWGTTDHIKKEAERWQEILGGKIDVYVPDLYDGQVAMDAAQAAKLSASVTDERKRAIINGLFSVIGQKKRVVTMGWCMGSDWAFKAALMKGEQVAGVVMYFGVPMMNDEEVKGLKSDVIFLNGRYDQFITKETVDNFERQVLATGKKFERHDFDAPHAFANPSNPQFDAKSAIAAEVFVVAFMKGKMQL
jgi:carboxymethylenebutenolidase